MGKVEPFGRISHLSTPKEQKMWKPGMVFWVKEGGWSYTVVSPQGNLFRPEGSFKTPGGAKQEMRTKLKELNLEFERSIKNSLEQHALCMVLPE